MIRHVDAAERILRPLSDLIGKPLRIATPGFTGEETLIRVAPGTILSSDETLTIDERRLISEILEVVRHADEQDERIRDLEGQVGKLASDNMQLAVKNQLLNEASALDALTGLYNRWLRHRQRSSRRSIARSATDSSMALLMLDIDHFKNRERHVRTRGRRSGPSGRGASHQRMLPCVRRAGTIRRRGVLSPAAGHRAHEHAERRRTDPPPAGDDADGRDGRVGRSHRVDRHRRHRCRNARSGAQSCGADRSRRSRALPEAKHQGRNRVEVWDSGEPRPLEHEH